MSDIAEALRQFPWRTYSQQHLAMRAAAHISQLEADFAEASKERSHQHGRADRNAREYANAQKTCEELRARIERLEAALRWALPLATIALEDCRQQRVKLGHTDIIGTYRNGKTWVGIHQSEVDALEEARAALAAPSAALEERT